MDLCVHWWPTKPILVRNDRWQTLRRQFAANISHMSDAGKKQRELTFAVQAKILTNPRLSDSAVK